MLVSIAAGSQKRTALQAAVGRREGARRCAAACRSRAWRRRHDEQDCRRDPQWFLGRPPRSGSVRPRGRCLDDGARTPQERAGLEAGAQSCARR
ncbi:MAG: hypothetical protein WDN31_14215 [Hyphomicrobium sp.]